MAKHHIFKLDIDILYRGNKYLNISVYRFFLPTFSIYCVYTSFFYLTVVLVFQLCIQHNETCLFARIAVYFLKGRVFLCGCKDFWFLHH